MPGAGAALGAMDRRETGDFQDCRHDVDHVAGIMPELTASGDPHRPVDDQGRGDPSLVNPRLVATKRCVGHARPARTQAQVRGRGACAADLSCPSSRTMISAGAVIGEKENKRIFIRTHDPKLVHDPADFLVHPVDHCCVYRHLDRLEFALLAGERAPRHGSIDLAGPERFEGPGKLVRRPEFALHVESWPLDADSRAWTFPSFGTRHIPAVAITITIPIDVRGRRLQGEMRRH